MAIGSSLGFRIVVMGVGVHAVACTATSGESEPVGETKAALTAIAGLYPTGVDDTGAVLAAGTADSHYSFSTTNNPNFVGTEPAIAVNANPAWVANTATATWVSVQASTVGVTNGIYTYSTTFQLPVGSLSLASITGQWTCDDSCVLLLNGFYVEQYAPRLWGQRGLRHPHGRSLRRRREHPFVRRDE